MDDAAPRRTAPRSLPAGLIPVLHGLACLLLATNACVQLLPLIALRKFGAGNWQTFAISAAVPTFFVGAIFWHALLERIGLRRYLAVHWCVAYVPLALIALAENYPQLLAAHLLAAVGAAGWSPVAGILLRRLYSDSLRGRAYGILNAVTLVGQMIALYAAGVWLAEDDSAFRRFLPQYVLLQAAALAILAWIAGGNDARGRAAPGPGASAPAGILRAVLRPLARTFSVLREDARFRRYEQAFMTYGCGWQIVDVLLPFFLTSRLHMTYDEVATNVYGVFRVAMLSMAIPTGWVMDRLGPARTAALAFVGLIAYPLLLLWATTPLHVAIASGVFGMVMSAVSVAWMLGPVAFAASPERVSEYVAIHTTLVGLRGILFQFLGMALYTATGDFQWPLLIAAAAFAWAAQQMWALHRDGARTAAAPPAPLARASTSL